jgi:hypothetical protein
MSARKAVTPCRRKRLILRVLLSRSSASAHSNASRLGSTGSAATIVVSSQEAWSAGKPEAGSEV